MEPGNVHTDADEQLADWPVLFFWRGDLIRVFLENFP